MVRNATDVLVQDFELFLDDGRLRLRNLNRILSGKTKDQRMEKIIFHKKSKQRMNIDCDIKR